MIEAFRGKRPFGMQINHIDGNKANNSAANLEYVTSKQNHVHGRRTGLHKTKLSTEQVKVIRQRISDGDTLAMIGREFGVSGASVWSIKHGVSWGHLDTIA